MNGIVIGLILLVVPSCSGCVTLDKTGTSGFKSVGVASQTLKKQDPARAGSFGAEREGFDRGRCRNFLSGMIMRRKSNRGVEFRVF